MLLPKKTSYLPDIKKINKRHKKSPFVSKGCFNFYGRKSNGRYLFQTFSFPYFYYTMGLNFRVQNFSKKIDDFLIFSFSLLIFKDYFFIKKLHKKVEKDEILCFLLQKNRSKISKK